MKFEDTKLPKDKVVQEAFNHANENNKALGPEIKAQIELQIENTFHQLDALRDNGQIDDFVYANEKARLEQTKRMLPQIVQQQLDMILREEVIAPALELHVHSENAAPEVLAAAMLVTSAPDPVDFAEIEANFGKAVSAPLAQVLHINAHRGVEAQRVNLANATDDAKRIFKANFSVALARLPLEARRAPPGKQLMMQEEVTFRPIKALWGSDKKQDARLVDVFNKAATALNAAYKIEIVKVDDKTSYPQLVKNTPPPAPPGQKKPDLGDNGF